MNRILPILSAGLLLASCNAGGSGNARLKRTPPTELVHPEWSRNAVIYEMNVRQHPKDGTLNSARADLARLHQLGIDIVWLMPVHPIGEVNRKGGENKDNYLVQPGSSSLGSPYSVQDYKALNPGLWQLGGFRRLRGDRARLRHEGHHRLGGQPHRL